MTDIRRLRWCVWASIALYVICLFLPVGNIGTPGTQPSGIDMLKLGALTLFIGAIIDAHTVIAVFFSTIAFTWFANLVLPLAWLCGFTGNRIWTAVFGLLALALMGTVFVDTVFIHPSLPSDPGTEKTLGLGYWIWVASAAACCFAVMARRAEAAEK